MHLLRAISAALVVLLLGACIDVDTRIVVEGDGSGTIRERVELKGPMADMLRQMEGEQKDGGLADRQKAEAHAKELGEGVRLESLEPLPGGALGALAVYAFDDVTKLSVKQNPMEGKEGMPGSPGARKPRTDTEPAQMHFRFEPGPPAVLTVVLHHESGAPGKGSSRRKPTAKAPDDPMAKKMMEGLKEMMEGMRMSMSVEVAGTIVETNATHRQGNSITLLELEIAKLLENDPEKMNALQPEGDVEAMKKALAGVEGVKVELEREVRIVFTPGPVMADAAPARAVPAPAVNARSTPVPDAGVAWHTLDPRDLAHHPQSLVTVTDASGLEHKGMVAAMDDATLVLRRASRDGGGTVSLALDDIRSAQVLAPVN